MKPQGTFWKNSQQEGAKSSGEPGNAETANRKAAKIKAALMLRGGGVIPNFSRKVAKLVRKDFSDGF